MAVTRGGGFGCTRQVLRGLAILATVGILNFSCGVVYGQSTAQLRRAIQSQFTASANLIVFPVALDGTSTGLVIVNRDAGHTRLVYERDTFLVSPQLSSDGARLMLVRHRSNSAARELLVCATATWSCTKRLQADGPILSPVEIGPDTILYSFSPPIRGPDGNLRYSAFDLYLVDSTPAPKRLTNFGFYSLDSLSLSESEIYFSAVGPSRNNPVIPEASPLAAAQSTIFKVPFDLKSQAIARPAEILQPLFAIKGYSTKPTVAPDLSRIAFLNNPMARGRNTYNLVVASLAGHVEQYIDATGLGFARPALLESAVLVNELFVDEIQVKILKNSNSSLEAIIRLDDSPRALQKLERQGLTIN